MAWVGATTPTASMPREVSQTACTSSLRRISCLRGGHEVVHYVSVGVMAWGRCRASLMGDARPVTADETSGWTARHRALWAPPTTAPSPGRLEDSVFTVSTSIPRWSADASKQRRAGLSAKLLQAHVPWGRVACAVIVVDTTGSPTQRRLNSLSADTPELSQPFGRAAVTALSAGEDRATQGSVSW